MDFCTFLGGRDTNSDNGVTIILMLVTNAGDKMCVCKVLDVNNRFEVLMTHFLSYCPTSQK